MYICMREIEKTTSQASQYIKGLKSGGQFDENKIEVTISSELQSILKDVKSFGNIEINTSPFSVQATAGRKDQAQNLFPTVPGIEQIKPLILRQLTIPEDMKFINITACSISPNGQYLILDSLFTSDLLLFSNDGMFMRSVVEFDGYSSDTCFVRNNTVAFTLVLEKTIALVDLEKNEIIETIGLSHVCCSVASDGQIMVIGSAEKSTLVNLSDESHTILEVSANCAALFKGNIYGTLNVENKVCCYKSTGELLWTFMHEDIDRIGGLALDKNGFVYIASRGNNSIVAVSPDGKTCKTILSEADGVHYPSAIDINRETGMMVMSNEISDDSKYDTAYVYKI